MSKYKLKDMKGVIPALITPFDEEEELDENRLRQVIEHLLNKRVSGFYLTGSTAEGFLMTPDERKRIVEVVVDQVDGRVPLIAHIGAIGTKISIDLAQHAAKTGVDSISSVPPFYWNWDNKSIIKYFREITQSTPLPMIVYAIVLAGLVSFDQIQKLSQIDGVEGIKYTASSHLEIMRMKEEIGQDFFIFSGADEMALSGLSSGADGIIGSFYNLIPELYFDILDAFKKNDLKQAAEKQRIGNIIIAYAHQTKNYLGVIKRAMSWMGVDAGYSRSPFSNFSVEEENVIKKGFKELKEKHKITDVDFLDAI